MLIIRLLHFPYMVSGPEKVEIISTFKNLRKNDNVLKCGRGRGRSMNRALELQYRIYSRGMHAQRERNNNNN